MWLVYDSHSDSSKERASLRQAISDDHKKLHHLAMQYNKLLETHGESLQLDPANLDEFLQGIFPWSELSGKVWFLLAGFWFELLHKNETGRQSVTMKRKHRFALLYCQKKRLQEEEVLLLQDMKNFLLYFKDHVVSDLERSIKCKNPYYQ